MCVCVCVFDFRNVVVFSDCVCACVHVCLDVGHGHISECSGIFSFLVWLDSLVSSMFVDLLKRDFSVLCPINHRFIIHSGSD